MAKREDEYKTIATPKDDQVVQVDAAKPSTNLSKGKASDVDDDFSFLAVYRYADAKDKLLLTAGFICSAVNGAGFPLMAILFGDAINAFVVPVNFDAVHEATLSFLLLAVGLFVAGYGSYACFAVSAERQMKKLRSECLKRIMYQDIGWYDQLDVSELASRISGDTVRIKDGMGDKLGEALRFFCQFLSGYIVGFSRGWNLSLVMACFMPLSSVSVAFLMKRLQQSAIHTQKVYAAAGAVAEETIGAMRTVASLNGEARAMAKYAANVAEAETVTIGVSTFVSVAFGWVFCLIWFTYAIGLWYGGWLVSKQHNTVSDPGTVLSAFYGILIGTMAVGQISPNLGAVAAANGAAVALFKILDSKSDIDASDMSGEIPPTCEGNIEARDVHFTYPSRPEDPILRGYSLTIKKGETVAFVGASGSGKSTLVALLERFYQPTSGAIYLDGRDISTLQLKWLRSQIGLVSQEPVLFATTIFENIAAGGDNISRDQVIAAAKLANAHDFIMGLPDGYDTVCGEKGATLSGGQKQRVAIARALVRQPKILVLDEATSALDNESERVVQDAINNLMAHTDMTTIVIAHRLSTIRNADKIAVISKGVVAELGRHGELMKLENGFYRSLVELQSSARIDEDDISAFEEYERRVYMALEAGGPETEESFTALLVRKSSSTSHVSVDKSLEYVGTVERAVKIGRIFELTKPQRLYYIFGVVASCIQGFTVPAIALILSRVISDMNLHYAEYVQSGKNDMAPLTALYDKAAHSAYLFIVAAVVVLVASFVQTYTFRVIAEKLTSRLRKMHFEALLRQDIGFFDLPGYSTGALTTDLSIHATKVVVIAGESQARILQAFFTIAAGLLIEFFMGNWKLALVAAAVFPFLLWGTYARFMQFKGQNFADNLGDSGADATEAITNARTVTAFGLQPDFLARYNVFLDIPLKEGTKQGHISGALNGFFSLIMFSVYALILWYGARLMNDGDITLQELMNTLMAIIRALGKLLASSETPTLPGSLKPSKVTGCIEFNDVFFNNPSRPDVKVLQHYDLTIEPGQTVAFCGPSGGGKSTCVTLLERFYNPTSGSITLDGHDISTLNLHWLRSQIGLVGQEPVLFVGTIAENIASGLSDSVPSTDLQERVEEAAKMANAHNFIMQFPDGYQTQVGLKGEQLSGGQKQRIAIARAIMKNPSILLLDEATSALDSESEKVVQEALDKLLAAKGRTTIVIAHRLSTIRNADKICVVSGGRIAEQGT
ncbi:hypothetical protein AeRB84_021133, partial [Aphanomyces euteiches]